MSRAITFSLTLCLLSACGEQAADPAPAPAPAVEPSPELVKGEAIVKGTCFVCHGQGINGAPIVGNAKMWGPRIPQGEDTLVAHAMAGFGLMPAKGGNDQLGEEDVRLAIRYMLSRVADKP